jgi:hypothetical protein
MKTNYSTPVVSARRPKPMRHRPAVLSFEKLEGHRRWPRKGGDQERGLIVVVCVCAGVSCVCLVRSPPAERSAGGFVWVPDASRACGFPKCMSCGVVGVHNRVSGVAVGDRAVFFWCWRRRDLQCVPLGGHPGAGDQKGGRDWRRKRETFTLVVDGPGVGRCAGDGIASFHIATQRSTQSAGVREWVVALCLGP